MGSMGRVYDELEPNGVELASSSSTHDPHVKTPIDISKLRPEERHGFIEKLIKNIEKDNLHLLQKTRKRLDRVGVQLPTVEVRYRNLGVEAECDVIHGKHLPTLWNSLQTIVSYPAQRLFGSKSHRAKMSIVKDVSGIIKPGRMSLLLGPPGCGKTSLLKALSGNLNGSLKVSGEVSYNGYKLEEFVPQKTSAYISQDDLHIPEMTVRETLDFSSRCQGLGNREELMKEVSRREKHAGIVPDPDIDTYMKATSMKGASGTLQTDYILKILGLDICAGTIVGDALRRGISGGQKKRLTTGEIIVGPIKTLFMDEITNGLDSSTAFQIIACLQQLVHITDATLLVSLLQPAPETFQLFDDIILMAEGKVVYHGPCDAIVEFFESCGFRCPQRKGIVNFLQEVISRKDQAQYWYNTELPYSYVSVDVFSQLFRESPLGKRINEDLSEPYDKSQCHKNALSFNDYSVSKWEIFRACMSREYLLMRRNSFLYIFKLTQLVIIAVVTMTAFLKSGMDIDILDANYYLGAMFYALLILVVDEFPEIHLTVSRLSIFYKQKMLYFYPAWAYAIPAIILKIPISFIQSLVWTSLTYYVMGYSPEVGRFFRQFLMYFTVQISSASMYRFLASVCQTMDCSVAVGTLVLFLELIFCGFIIPQSFLPSWLRWGFWVSPLTYATIGLSGNEFHAPRWQRVLAMNSTIGQETLRGHGFYFEEYFFWISIGVLLGFALLWNLGFTLVLSFLKSPGSSRVVISHEKLSTVKKGDSLNGAGMEDVSSFSNSCKKEESNEARMVLPFDPATLTFQNVQYHVDTPQEMRKEGYAQRKLQILSDITGAARPGVLTALMGPSGAGKTTLLDVLAGRKTIGYIEGEIRVNGYPKVQETFARISGYCEQNDIHSPQITVKESLIFSAWMRLPACIDSKTKTKFVQEVIETIELDGVEDALVGTPGLSGLSTEQRKRLTIAVELVANPSIIFMDEPTTSLDARAAAIVMRAVKNVVDTGRTIVCTIHQPSIDIFEAFDELIYLKTGGSLIYYGPLGQNSSKVIEYFENIPGVPKIKDNCNPATWMLEATSASVESELGIDFAEIYKNSSLYENNEELVRQLSNPAPGSRDVHFPTQYAQNYWGQIRNCLWKLHLSYWRSPSYNLMRFMFTTVISLTLGLLSWDQGTKITNQQSLFNIFGSMYGAVLFLGTNSGSAVQPFVATERIVMYRERFAGMYSSWSYALAQVLIEIPYLFAQAVVFVIITYSMIGYYVTAYKVFWYFYAIFSTLLSFSLLGMLLVSLTPNTAIAGALTSTCYPLTNLFSGFLLPKLKIPSWWIWMYYLMPTSWTLNMLLSSQYGDVNDRIVVYTETTTVAALLEQYFGFGNHNIAVPAVVLFCYPLIFSSLFAFFINRLNFERR
ncbi:polar auxin transport inhibitor sensitive 1, PLEIOTROPIC DRUG RESISTANCE 9 [Hibiscus trionum]|uniref:Polar auxin transport inhibitor sensitive 1, PLEIOTROPIC DRUG RESISTANCE 9 n=1 Tax=Hibiscus trionum TaxID=183268 RepID=A0A9W7IP30_HIBTR|nr:polar auxin transport inhibitor sensitive 1, PLEIOTROPIC DRUG RESISTANCE 9 [Hibiscus trionum]